MPIGIWITGGLHVSLRSGSPALAHDSQLG